MSDRPLIIGLGEVLWDCFPTERRPGGAPANVAFQANQLGGLGIICSRVGQDPFGEELVAFLEAQGLQARHLQFDPVHPTGTVSVALSAEGEPSYTIHEGVAWDFLEFSPDWQALMSAASAVCFGTLAQRTPAGCETVRQCLRATHPETLRVFDVNLRQRFYSREVVEESLALCNVLKINSGELETIRELLGIDADDPLDVSRRLIAERGVELVCVTRGEAGCRLISAREDLCVASRPVRVVDAVGAGDAFTAGLIVGLLSGWPLSIAGEFANRVGGLVAASSGAMPRLEAEFEVLRGEFAAHERR